MNKKIVSGLLVAITFSAGHALAEASDPPTYDKIWGYGTFYDNEDTKVIQKFGITGRLQGDAHSFVSEDASNDDIVWRRFRFGFKATLFQDIVLHSEMDLDMNEANSGDWDMLYNRLTDTYVSWSPSNKPKVKRGKQSTGFTLDGATSSKKLIVPKRSIVAGNLWFGTEYFTGATASGSIED